MQVIVDNKPLNFYIETVANDENFAEHLRSCKLIANDIKVSCYINDYIVLYYTNKCKVWMT